MIRNYNVYLKITVNVFKNWLILIVCVCKFYSSNDQTVSILVIYSTTLIIHDFWSYYCLELFINCKKYYKHLSINKMYLNVPNNKYNLL